MDAVAQEYVRRLRLRRAALAEGVRQLHQRFVSPGPFLDAAYLARASLRHAYTAYYTPLHALRVAALLNEMRAYTGAFLERDLDVVDFGAGTGAGILGLLAALGDQEIAIRYTAVDHVRAVEEDLRRMVEIACELWRPRAETKVHFRTDLPRVPSRLVLLLHALTEIGTPQIVEDLIVDVAHEAGYVVVMEPATKEHTQRLQRLRDQWVAQGYRIAAPCPAQARCPMRMRDDLWCHADVPWEWMGLTADLDRRAGLRKDSLKFSYMVLTRSGHSLVSRFGHVARVVSNVHAQKGKTWAEVCGPSPDLLRVEWLARARGPQTRDFAHARRGDTFAGFDYEDRGDYGRLRAAFRVARLSLPRAPRA
jgi:ribosomal protein RSM22 (predicted rRNA methylase)